MSVTQIWQCEGCGATFPEYVNGCVFADNDPTHPTQKHVVLIVENHHIQIEWTPKNDTQEREWPPSTLETK